MGVPSYCIFLIFRRDNIVSTAQHPRSKLRSLLLRTVRRMLLVLVLYVLSIGPMFGKWEQARATGDDEIVIALYLPMMVACDISPPFRRAINAYIDLWTFA